MYLEFLGSPGVVVLSRGGGYAQMVKLPPVDVHKSFLKLGCLWPNDDGSHIALRGLPNYEHCGDNAFIDFAPQAVDKPKSAPPAKCMKQASIAGFFEPRASASSSSGSSS